MIYSINHKVLGLRFEVLVILFCANYNLAPITYNLVFAGGKD